MLDVAKFQNRKITKLENEVSENFIKCQAEFIDQKQFVELVGKDIHSKSIKLKDIDDRLNLHEFTYETKKKVKEI